MFYLNHHGSTQMRRLRDVFMCVFAHWKTAVCTLFWLTKTCLCVNFNIRHYVCHQISNRRSRNDVQPHDLTYEPFSVCNFSHTKSCLRTLVWPTRRIVMRVHCEKTSLYTTFWLTTTCNDSFQFNRATMVTSEHKSTTEGANFDKQSMSRDIVQDKCESREKSISRHRYKSTSRSVRRRGKIIDSSSKSMGVPKRYILGDQTWEPLHLPMLL